MNKEEKNYLDLLKNILDNGNQRSDRTGIGTIGIFGSQLRFSLENNKVPMLTTKKMFTKGVVEELLFFLRGETDTKKLEAKGVNIWKGNTTRDFLDKRGLPNFPEGEMGPMYGHQWRNWGGTDSNKGIDQISNAIDLIKTDPYSRRIVVNAWNVSDLDNMCLAPCHPMFQFYVNDGKLSCHFTMRSCDIFLGAPFNILSYGILTHLMAKLTNLKPGELIFSGGDVHIYSNHVEQVKTQISREPFEFPTMTINKKIETIKDIELLELSDFNFDNYQSHSSIKAEMAV